MSADILLQKARVILDAAGHLSMLANSVRQAADKIESGELNSSDAAHFLRLLDKGIADTRSEIAHQTRQIADFSTEPTAIQEAHAALEEALRILSREGDA